MMKKWWLQLLLLAAVAVPSLPAPAAALTDVWLNTVGISYIGRLGSNNRICTYSSATGALSWQTISNGALFDNTRVRGTGSRDHIILVTGTWSVCGTTLTPISRNGFSFDVLGESGNDILYGKDGYYIGAGGIDIINVGLNGVANGGSSADYIFSDGSNAYLIGEVGDNCFFGGASSTALALIGGVNFDTACGVTATAIQNAIDSFAPQDCTVCWNKYGAL
jgi:Ca2+-binding RTX toxin-like protein